MDFVNNAGLDEHAPSADLLRTNYGDDELLVAVIARTTFSISHEGVLSEHTEHIWPVGPGELETPAGPMPGDKPFLLGGVDVFLTGHVRAPEDKPLTRTRVALQIGDRFRREVDVVGDRFWRHADPDDPESDLVMTEPEPFTSMPLSYERSFGGRAMSDEGPISWPANPGGRGFAALPERCAGTPLPNLEDPLLPIQNWDDRPGPASLGPYPDGGSLRPIAAMDMDMSDPNAPIMRRVTPLMFNRAHPQMVIPAPTSPKAGDEVMVEGVSPSGPIRFALPVYNLHAHVQLGVRERVLPLHLDTVGIDTDTRTLMLGHRVVFRYRVRKGERRRATLYRGRAPRPVPSSYTIDWTESASPTGGATHAAEV